MITITTINNSWYFLGDLVIKPNSSSAYQEENLSKNQAKDLLESVSSKRVSLSSEDLIKVQDRYDSFNSGGNVDLSGIISKIENIYKDDGVSGAILTNVEYNDGVFNYTSGTVNGSVGYTAVESISVVQSGTLTVASVPTGVTYLAVISGNQVPNDFPAVVLTLGDGTLATTQTSYPVSYGDIIEIEWTTNSISALIDGQWVSSTTEDTLDDPHLLVFSLLNTDPLYFSIPGFAAGGVRSGVLVEEIDERIAADLDITEALSHKASLGEDGKILSEQLPDVVTAPDWSSISSKPTTLSGYGITDAYTKTQVDTAISGINGTGGAIPRPKFVGGTKRYLTGVWHDYSFGWVPTSGGYANATIGGGRSWLYPFIPLDNCVVSDLGICTGSNFAGNIKLGFYDSNSAAKPNNKLFSSSLIDTAVTNTVLSASTGGISVTAGNLYWIALFSQSGGNPSIVHCNQNLFPILSAGYANTSPTNVYGYMLNADGFNTQTDLPTFPAAEPFMSYADRTTAPRLVFKISS